MPFKNASKSEIEQELKIQLTARDLEKVFKALKKKALRKKVEHKYMPRAYFDTRGLDLYRRSVSLRIQYKPGKQGRIGAYEQTVKFELPDMAKQAGGVLCRKECKDLLRGRLPELARVADPQCRRVLRPFRGKKFIHIFTVAVERRSFDIKVGGGKKGGTVEVAFDVGEIILDSNGRHYPFYEIEVEMKKGNPEAMHSLARKVREIARSARPQPLSKSQHGSRLYRKSVYYRRHRR